MWLDLIAALNSDVRSRRMHACSTARPARWRFSQGNFEWITAQYMQVRAALGLSDSLWPLTGKAAHADPKGGATGAPQRLPQGLHGRLREG